MVEESCLYLFRNSKEKAVKEFPQLERNYAGLQGRPEKTEPILIRL